MSHFTQPCLQQGSVLNLRLSNRNSIENSINMYISIEEVAILPVSSSSVYCVKVFPCSLPIKTASFLFQKLAFLQSPSCVVKEAGNNSHTKHTHSGLSTEDVLNVFCKIVFPKCPSFKICHLPALVEEAKSEC